jgi:hypothetical protein
MAKTENEALIRSFYDSFARGDAGGMNACYAPGIVFSDPVFGSLEGDRARGMWTMLCRGLKDFNLTYEVGDVDDTSGHAHWVATYTYSATGRRVRNVIDATFLFASGLIARHDDRFDLWKWSSQALGAPGMLLGWTPFFKKKVSSMATSRLDAFLR